MHPDAYEWVARHATSDPLWVLDIGGRDINGTTRPLFPTAQYTVLDIAPGPGVGIVADAATWVPDREYDVVVCTEVFEHTADWRQIIRTAYNALAPDGHFICTMAGPGRKPHSTVDGGPHLRPGEHYANVQPADLYDALQAVGFTGINVDQYGEDVRAHAVVR